jgi:hypothetical protein
MRGEGEQHGTAMGQLLFSRLRSSPGELGRPSLRFCANPSPSRRGQGPNDIDPYGGSSEVQEQGRFADSSK